MSNTVLGIDVSKSVSNPIPTVHNNEYADVFGKKHESISHGKKVSADIVVEKEHIVPKNNSVVKQNDEMILEDHNDEYVHSDSVQYSK